MIGGLPRIELLGVPLDIVGEDELEGALLHMLDNREINQIVLLDFRKFMKARGQSEFAAAVRKASMVLPVSNSLCRGARFLNKSEPRRVFPFDFVIRTLGILEKHAKSMYLIGSKVEELSKVENNLRASFPGLRLLGRCTGFFHKNMEKDILLAIKKANPALLFAGPGVKGKESWIHTHRSQLSPGIFLWWEEGFEIFSGRKEKPSKALWKSGLDGLSRLPKKPWRIFGGFLYIWFFLLLLFDKIRKY